MFKSLKRAVVGILAALGVLFVIVMLWPDDEEESGRDAASATSASASSVVSAVNASDSESARDIELLSVGTDAKSATVMVYMNGSDLESQYGEATGDISEMIASGIGGNVNVVIQTMGTKKWKDYGISSKTAQTYAIKDGQLNLVRDNLGQLDSTSADTLSEFVGFCKESYPAERYIFLFWNHGGGPVYGFGYDEWQGEDESLTIDEMATAFSKHSDVHFDIIGMDCCIMASLETCYALAPYCKYALLSEDFESGLGWSYTEWMKTLEENPGISTTLLGKYIIDSIISDNETNADGDSACMGLFNVSTASGLFDAWKNWAYKNESSLLSNNYSKKHKAKGRFNIWDLWGSDDSNVTLSDYYISDVLAMVENIDNSSDEAKELTSALKASVAYYAHTSDKNELTGLAVSLPYGDDYFYDKLCDVYEEIGFDSEYITWLGKFVSGHGNNDYYDYDYFSDHWGGWGSYEDDYGFNSSNGGFGQYSWYDWGDEWGDDYGYGYDYGCYDDGYADDWVYDYESELWYCQDGDTLYLYDDETNTLYYYDEDSDTVYAYDEDTEDWYPAE